MLNDDELRRLRALWTAAAIAPVNHRGTRPFPAWDDMLLDPTPETITAFFHDPDTPVGINISVFDAMAQLGMAVASDVLDGAPVEIDDNSNRRWQQRRELGKIVAGMDEEKLQRLIYWGRSIAQ